MAKTLTEVDIKELKRTVLSLPDSIFEKFIESINKERNIKKNFIFRKKEEKKFILETLRNISVWNENDIEKIEGVREEINKWKINDY